MRAFGFLDDLASWQQKLNEMQLNKLDEDNLPPELAEGAWLEAAVPAEPKELASQSGEEMMNTVLTWLPEMLMALELGDEDEEETPEDRMYLAREEAGVQTLHLIDVLALEVHPWGYTGTRFASPQHLAGIFRSS